MSAAPLVSVIVPNFNHRRFLPERMNSIFAQTHRNLEIVFLDDASSDGSLDYVRSLESPFPLRILANATNSGSVFRQWHRGLSEVTADFVWIAESDDSCRVDLVEKLLAVALRNPAVGLAYAQSQIVDEEGREIGSFLDFTDEIDRDRWRRDYVNSGRDEAARYLVIRNTIPNASACLFRRAALLEAQLESISLQVCGDWLAYARICARYDIAFVADHLNLYRRHSGTARARAAGTGGVFAEMYFVQSYIEKNFEVSPAAREAGCHATFQGLLHALKHQLGGRTFIDDAGVLSAASPFDPRLRERMAERPIPQAPTLKVVVTDQTGFKQSHTHTYDLWQWTRIQVGPCRGSASIVPLTRPGLVAMRHLSARDGQTDAVLWSASTAEDYQRIELDGDAHRVGSRDALEIFAWDFAPLLHLPLPEHVRSGAAYSLEFDIRLAALPSAECSSKRELAKQIKRALFVLPHLELGGADRFNLDLIVQLTRRFGWEITVVTTRCSEDPWQQKFRELTSEVFMLHRFLPVEAYPEFLAYLIESRQFDVVYLSHSEFGYRLLPWLKAMFPILPVVDLLHIVVDDWRQGGFPRFSCGSKQWINRTIVTSDWLKDWLVQRDRSAEGIEIVHTNIDTEYWQRSPQLSAQARERWDLPKGRPVILYAARFSEQKQPRLLLPILSAIEARGHSVLLLLAGDGPERGWLEEHLCKPHQPSVRMLGPVAPDDMRSLLSATDVLLLPSREEGIALVLFEALSMEVTPIATEVGGQRELLSDEFARILPFDDKLVKRMTDELDGLLRDPENRRRLGRLGRIHVERYHRLAVMGNKMDQLLGALVPTRSARLVRTAVIPLEAEAAKRNAIKVQKEAQASEDLWSRSVEQGKIIPRIFSAMARTLRQTPYVRRLFRRFELRYGESLGRLIFR